MRKSFSFTIFFFPWYFIGTILKWKINEFSMTFDRHSPKESNNMKKEDRKHELPSLNPPHGCNLRKDYHNASWKFFSGDSLQPTREFWESGATTSKVNKVTLYKVSNQRDKRDNHQGEIHIASPPRRDPRY